MRWLPLALRTYRLVRVSQRVVGVLLREDVIRRLRVVMLRGVRAMIVRILLQLLVT